MNRTVKRQFLLLGAAVLAAMSLSMYDKYGNIFENVPAMKGQETESAGQEKLAAQVLEENEIARGQKKEAVEEKTAAETEKKTEKKTAEEKTEGETAGEENQAEAAAENEAAADAVQQNPNIRVLICSDNYESKYHESITIQATAPFTLSYGDITENYSEGDVLYFDKESFCLRDGKAVLTLQEDGVFQLPLLKRSQSCPSYEGTFTVEKRGEGLLLVNTLPLETYLCYVVPSEMPSSYPIEALKAQAVCARCYARRQMENGRCSEYGADVDDSVSYQVYNNIGKSDEAVQAVEETAGIVMEKDGEIQNALYYSTSCGIRLEDDLSEEAVFCSFLAGSSGDGEETEPWYRWNVFFPADCLYELAENAYPGQIGNVTGITVLERESNGCAETLLVSGDLGEVLIEGEYDIRKFLNPAETAVSLQDGSTAPQLGMLPSAFFYVTPEYEDDMLTGFLLNGGGYGHGNGMSQNGAKHMAQDGKTCNEILKYYYGDGVEMVCSL